MKKQLSSNAWCARFFVALVAVLGLAISANAQSYAQSFHYDALGRLISATYVDGGTTLTVTYTYDDSGNRTAKTTTSP